MKLSITFLAILGLAVAVPANELHSRKVRSLDDDFSDLFDIIASEEVVAVFVKYFSSDPEVKAAGAYIKSEEFGDVLRVLDAFDESIASLAGIENFPGIVRGVIDMISPLWDLYEFGPDSSSESDTGGVPGLINELLAVLPTDEIKALRDQKLKNSPEFAALTDVLSSPVFEDLFEKLQDNKDVKKFVSKLSSSGVDVNKLMNLGRSLIGID